MSCRTVPDSTFAQFGLAGVDFEVLAALSKTATSGSVRLTPDSASTEFGITPPSLANCVWIVLPAAIFSQSRARSWFFEAAEMPRFEPPRKFGASLPAFLLGTANAPILSLSSGLSLVMTPICQPGSRIMPTLPVSNAAASVVSSPSFGALEYLLTVSFSQLRPATDWDESRLPFHL